MLLAHDSLVHGGPTAWLMVLAGVLLAMAIYLAVTKGPPRTILVLMLLAIAIVIGSVAAPNG
jgi:uncharacterized membrane protein